MLGERLRGVMVDQAERAFVWLVVAFGAGTVLFFAWQTDPAWWWSVVIVAVGGALLPLRRRYAGVTFIAFAIIAVGLGHGAAHWRTDRVATPLLARESRPFMLTATVQAAARASAGNRLVLSDFTLPDTAPRDTPRRLRLTIPEGHGLPEVGARISLRAVVRPAAQPVMPDGFQFQRFLYFQGIGGVGYAVGRWQRVEGKDSSGSLRAQTEALRRRIGDRIAQVVPGDDGAVAGALVNGEQNAIPEDLQEAYRVAGIAHLLSISGVHMTLLAGVVFFLVRRLLALVPAVALRVDTKKLAAVAGLAVTTFYLLISGMSVPAVRSFLMIAVVMTAILLDRTALSLRTIAWAALVLMAVYPDAIVSASFQMSFLAVLALVALYEQSWLHLSLRNSAGELDILRIVGLYLLGLVVTDIAAGGTTSLFAAYHFNRLPTYSVITNLIAVPLTGLWIMPAAVLSLLLMPFGADALALKVMGAGVGWLNDVARTVAAWPGAQVPVPPMQTWALALGALGVIFVCLWRGRTRWAGTLLILPALIQPFATPLPDLLVDDTARVFAVGDGQGLVIRPGRAGRFVREVWAERYGTSPVKWGEVGDLSCDADGCVIARDDHRILLAFTATALAEDCGAADLVISTTAARDLCRQGRIVDLLDLRREGAVAVWLSEEGAQVRSVRDSTGNRVWMRGEVAEADDNAPEIDP